MLSHSRLSRFVLLPELKLTTWKQSSPSESTAQAKTTSKIKAVKKLRRTLMSWRTEILNYFKTGLTNARTEGFNNVAKLVNKRAYGYKNFGNYRLRLLNACC